MWQGRESPVPSPGLPLVPFLLTVLALSHSLRPQVHFCGHPLATPGRSQRYGLRHLGLCSGAQIWERGLCVAWKWHKGYCEGSSSFRYSRHPQRRGPALWVVRALCTADSLPCGEGLEQSRAWDPSEGSPSSGLRVILLEILDAGNVLNLPYHKAIDRWQNLANDVESKIMSIQVHTLDPPLTHSVTLSKLLPSIFVVRK